MSVDAVCLRCDWRGSTEGAGGPCPACGVPLFLEVPDRPEIPLPLTPASPPPERPRPDRSFAAPGSEPLDRPPDPDGDPSPPSPGPDPGPGPRLASGESPPRMSPRRLVRQVVVPTVVLLVVGILVALAARPAGGPARPPADGSLGPGHLLYASDDDPEHLGIYRLDLSTGHVTAGQPLPGVTELVPIADDLGSIGITRRNTEGTLEAFALSSVTPNARVAPIASGDMIAWGPEGESVLAVRTGPDVRCRPHVRADVVDLSTWPPQTIPVFRAGRLCGDVLAVALDRDRAYLSIARGEVVRTSWTSPAQVLHRAVPVRTLNSLSPTGDMIVTPVRFLSSGFIPGRDPDPGPIPQLAGASELTWRGRGGPAPITSGGEPIQVQRTLAWTPDGSRALVVGTPLVGEPAIYEMPGGVGEGDREADEIWGIEGPIGGASYDEDGSAYLVMDRQMIRITDGELSRIPLPEGAPLPTGPVLWVPTAPRSRAR